MAFSRLLSLALIFFDLKSIAVIALLEKKLFFVNAIIYLKSFYIDKLLTLVITSIGMEIEN